MNDKDYLGGYFSYGMLSRSSLSLYASHLSVHVDGKTGL